jgi:hypothetical protein
LTAKPVPTFAHDDLAEKTRSSRPEFEMRTIMVAVRARKSSFIHMLL